MRKRPSSLGWSIAATVPVALAIANACASDEAPPADEAASADTNAAGAGGGPLNDGMTTTTATDAIDPVPASSPTSVDTDVPSATSTPSAVGGDANVGAGGMSRGGMGGASAIGGEAGSGTGGLGGAGTSGAGAGAGTGGTGLGGTDTSDAGAGGRAGDGAGGSVAGSGGAGGAATIDPNSPGCGTPITRPDRNVQQTMEIGGTTRYYLLDVPQGADNETPLMLIFALHGFDMNNVAVKDLYNFTERSNGQAITVMPQGEGPPPGDVSHWGDGVLESTWSPNEANFDYLEALIETLGESYCIDRTRVFIVGFSMGGFFTNAIACERNDWFRGFAPIAGGGPSACADGVEAAIMVQHGTVDPIVDISSGEESRDTWIEQNGCSQSSTPTFDGCETYDGCPDGKPVVWCTGNYDHYIPESVTSNIWSFFSEL